MSERVELLNDDRTNNIMVVRPSSYSYAQPDPSHVSKKKKHPLGFIHPEPKRSSK